MDVKKYVFGLFIFWYVVGVFLLLFDLLPPMLEWANAVFLILAGILGAIYFIANYSKAKGFFLSFFIISTTIFVEWLGVEFSLFFGHYDYNSDFGWNIAGVPIAIGFAWLMVISTTHVLAKQIIKLLRTKNKIILGFFYALIGGLAAVVIDLVIDPVAFHVKQYWLWHDGGFYYDIPFSNFTGWFILAFFLHVVVYVVLQNDWHLDRNLDWKKKMVIVNVLIILMFVILAFQGKLLLSAFITLAATIILIALYRKANEYD
jgi:bisanhydrobacterioruberin hydratase